MPNSNAIIHSSNEEMLSATVDLAGLNVVDVGCGDGHYTRYMACEGADVIGIECSTAQLAKANSHPIVSSERYRQGVGEDLQVRSETADLVTFIYSLHHVPVGSQMKALLDAARALKPDGLIYVAEPLAQGCSFDFFAPLDDETEVRAAAYQAIQDVRSLGLAMVRELTFVTRDIYPDFESFEEETIRISSARAVRLLEIRQEMKDRFHQYGVELPDGSFAFEQPVRINLLRKS